MVLAIHARQHQSFTGYKVVGSELRKDALLIIAEHLHLSKESLPKLFARADYNGNGWLGAQEMKDLLLCCNPNLTPRQLKRCMSEVRIELNKSMTGKISVSLQDLRLGLQNLHQDYIAELASWPVSKAAAEAAAAAAKKQQQQQQALTQQKQAPAAQQSLTLQPQQSTTIPSSTAIVQQDQGKQQEGFGLYPGEKKEQAQAPPTTQLTLQQQWPQYPRVLSKTVLIQHDLAKQGSSSGPYPIIYPRQTQKQQLQLPPPQPKAPALPAPQQQQAPSAEQLAKYPIVRESTVLVQTELGKQGSSTGPYPAIYPFVKEQHEQQLKLAQQTPQKQITAAQPVAQQQQVTSAQPAEQPKVESSTTYPNVRAFASPITPAQIKEFTEAHISKDSPKTDAHRALHYPKIN